ncbi:MAG: type II toxin-antitoxin system RelE/ParE family toxin [Hyphomicrobiales bacterium]
MRLSLSRQAERDLVAIGSWLAERNPRASEELLEALKQRLIFLKDNPMAGRARDDIAEGMRGHVMAPYLILYRYSELELFVVRVVDGRRDLNSLF